MDCWKVLGVSEGTDAGALKRRYRELMKQHHPDRALTPERVRRSTIRSAEIIRAYGEAQTAAKKQSRPRTTQESAPRTQQAQAPTRYPSTWVDRLFSRLSGNTGAVVILVVIGLGTFLIVETLDLLESWALHAPAGGFRAVVGGSVLAVLGGVALSFPYWFLLVTVFFSLVHYLLRQSGVVRFADKLAWLIVVAVHTTVLGGVFDFGRDPDLALLEQIPGVLFALVVAYAVPIALAWGWVFDFVRYRRARNTVLACPDN